MSLGRSCERRRSRFLCVCQAAVRPVVESCLAGSRSDFSEELVLGVEPAALDCRVAPWCPPGPAARAAFVADHDPPNVVSKPRFQFSKSSLGQGSSAFDGVPVLGAVKVVQPWGAPS